jgi:hypothetical protein
MLKVSDFELIARADTAQAADMYLELELTDAGISPHVPFQIVMQISQGQAEFVMKQGVSDVALISPKEIVFLHRSYKPFHKIVVKATVTKLVKGDYIVLTLKLNFAQ